MAKWKVTSAPFEYLWHGNEKSHNSSFKNFWLCRILNYCDKKYIILRQNIYIDKFISYIIVLEEYTSLFASLEFLVPQLSIKFCGNIDNLQEQVALMSTNSVLNWKRLKQSIASVIKIVTWGRAWAYKIQHHQRANGCRPRQLVMSRK